MRVAQANRQHKLNTLIRLVEKRLEVYPLLYPHLSRFIKSCNYNAVFRQTPVSKVELKEFLDSINECDSKMSFIFSDETGKSMRLLQKEVIYLLSKMLINMIRKTLNLQRSRLGRWRQHFVQMLRLMELNCLESLFGSVSYGTIHLSID